MEEQQDMVEEPFLERTQQKLTVRLLIWQDILRKILLQMVMQKKCEIQIAYSIGVAKPVSIYVNTYGTNTIPEEEIVEKIDKTFDFNTKRHNKLSRFTKTNL